MVLDQEGSVLLGRNLLLAAMRGDLVASLIFENLAGQNRILNGLSDRVIHRTCVLSDDYVHYWLQVTNVIIKCRLIYRLNGLFGAPG